MKTIRRVTSILLFCICVTCAAGCGPLFVFDCMYRSATYDDVVYVKENKILYKRKRRDGILAPQSLIDTKVGSLTGRNDKVIIYPDYRTAILELKSKGMEYTLDPVSKPNIPYDTCKFRWGSLEPTEEEIALHKSGKTSSAVMGETNTTTGKTETKAASDTDKDKTPDKTGKTTEPTEKK